MLAGGCLAAAFGLLAGYLSFRYGLRGPVLLAGDAGLRGDAARRRREHKAVGSSLGLVHSRAARPAPCSFVFAGKLPYYYVILAMALARAAAHAAPRALAARLRAGRDPRERGRGRGVRRRRARASSCGAMARVVVPHRAGRHLLRAVLRLHRPRPSRSGPAVSIQGLLRPSWAAPGTVLGPLLGSFVLTPISELTRAAHPRARRRRRHGLRAGPDPRHLVPAERPDGLGPAAARRGRPRSVTLLEVRGRRPSASAGSSP